MAPRMSADFDTWFQAVTEHPALPYQRELATSDALYRVLRIPTGLGKTQAILGAWLWRRRFAADGVRQATPRRLAYCLPMRVLVEQTHGVAADMLARAGLGDEVGLRVLMGGEAGGDWDVRPEDDTILIGTQDMLLSRALNRGYAMSRYRWPIHFALLNDDVLWVIDEPQLFGAGLPTTAQLAAFRRQFGTFGPTATIWASATLEPSWLHTVDVRPDLDLTPELALGPRDHENPVVRRRLDARKEVTRADTAIGDAAALAALVRREHRPASRTIVVVNTVQRARELYAQLTTVPSSSPKKKGRKTRSEPARIQEGAPRPDVVLIHSRFRPEDRRARVEEVLREPGPLGTIVVSTQVIEAGVDVSAETLVTELAPWASIVQRLGRCNRKGELARARVFWCPLPQSSKDRKGAAAPYELEELERADEALSRLTDGSPSSIAALGRMLDDPQPSQVVRRRDLVELFDTTPDLSGADVDVSRFIREGDDRDVHVFWRDFDGYPGRMDAPTRAELCPAPIGEMRDFLARGDVEAWRWDLLERPGSARPAGLWRPIDLRVEQLFPGLEVLLRARAGGYSPTRGWDPSVREAVPPPASVDGEQPDVDRSDDDEPLTVRACRSLRDHSDDTAREAARIVAALPALGGDVGALVVRAARWHDLGKAHPVFQDTLRRSGCSEAPYLLAKSPLFGGTRHERPGFRHELASALAALAHGEPDLLAYMLAAHHGKVRLRIRSQPSERPPPESGRLFARGVWEGDSLPEVDLGDGVVVPPTVLSLDYMALGGSDRVGESWTARMTGLRDSGEWGPFRLAYLEAVVRAADERASGAPGDRS